MISSPLVRTHSILQFNAQVLHFEKTDSRFLNETRIGGSASAAGELVEKCGAKVIENLFVIEIELYVLNSSLPSARLPLLVTKTDSTFGHTSTV